MREALIEEQSLAAPTVGRWRPAVQIGAPLRPGLLLGHLDQGGLSVPISAPVGAGGVATAVQPAGSWVAFGAQLVAMGEGSGALSIGATARPRSADAPDDVDVIRAETDGTVYLRPSPDKPPFVAEGAEILPRATVALIEVMKTFTPVRAETGGRLARICVTDGAPVEAGAALFWVRPAES